MTASNQSQAVVPPVLSAVAWEAASPGHRLTGVRAEHWIQDLGLEGARCYAAIDVHPLPDAHQLCIAEVFPPADATASWVVLLRAWLTGEGSRRLEGAGLGGWVSDSLKHGWLRIASDRQAIHDASLRHIDGLSRTVQLVSCAHDRWALAHWARRAAAFANTVELSQGFSEFDAPTRKLLALIGQQRLAHGHNPVLAKHARGVALHLDFDGKVKPSRTQSVGPTGGINATLMAIGAALADGERA